MDPEVSELTICCHEWIVLQQGAEYCHNHDDKEPNSQKRVLRPTNGQVHHLNCT